MILGEVFERFAQKTPLTVMARGLLENVLNPTVVDQLFEDVAERQYTKKLLFSSIVDLMSVVVCRIQPAICSAYQDQAETLNASLKAVASVSARVRPVTVCKVANSSSTWPMNVLSTKPAMSWTWPKAALISSALRAWANCAISSTPVLVCWFSSIQ